MTQEVRWAHYHGPQDEDESARIRASELYKHGDTIIVWVNEGDIVMHPNMDGPKKKRCGPCNRAGNVAVCWDRDCDFRDPPAEADHG